MLEAEALVGAVLRLSGLDDLQRHWVSRAQRPPARSRVVRPCLPPREGGQTKGGESYAGPVHRTDPKVTPPAGGPVSKYQLFLLFLPLELGVGGAETDTRPGTKRMEQGSPQRFPPPRKVKPDLEVSKGLGLGQKKVWGQRAPLIQRLLFPADVNIHRKLIWAGPKVSVIASDQIGRTHTEAGRRAPCQWCLRRTGLLQAGRP